MRGGSNHEMDGLRGIGSGSWLRGRLVGPGAGSSEDEGHEEGTRCAAGNCKKSISLVRLALFCVLVPGFGPNLSAFGPKWTQVFSQLGRRQAGATRRASRPSHQPRG